MSVWKWIRDRRLYFFVTLVCLCAFVLGYCGVMTVQVQGILVVVTVAGLGAILGRSFEQHRQQISDILGNIAWAAAEVKEHDLGDAAKQVEAAAKETAVLVSEVKKEQTSE